jgi:hypothetical protein
MEAVVVRKDICVLEALVVPRMAIVEKERITAAKNVKVHLDSAINSKCNYPDML